MSGSGTDYTTTPNLGLYKPIANMAVGLWGDLWNSNADAIDAAIHFASGGGPFLPLAGGTVTGNILTHGNTEAYRGSFGTQDGNPVLFDGSIALKVMANPTFSAGMWNQSFLSSTNGQGSTTATGQPQWNLCNTVDSVHASAIDSIANLAAYYTLQGSVGSRTNIMTSLVVNGNTNDAVGSGNYFQAMSGGITVNGTIGGSSIARGGQAFGSNITATLGPNGKYVTQICGLEIDVACQAGSSVWAKGGMTVVLQNGDAVESGYPSAGYTIALNSDSPASSKGWTYGFVFGSGGSYWMMNTTTGIMIYADPNPFPGGPAMTCASGIDFSAVTFSTAFLKSRGFLVDGSGHVSPLLANATTDAAAATAGVPIGALYRNGNAVQVRLV